MAKRRVLVTAGASGIGLEIVRAFSANGAGVFVCDINPEALKALEGEIPSVKTGLCDVSKREDVERMMTECVRVLGGLDVLVNNAASPGPPPLSKRWTRTSGTRSWRWTSPAPFMSRSWQFPI